MAEALVEEKKIKDDEFDIHGDLAVSEAEDKSFVILYDSAQKTASPKTNEHPIDESQAPALDDFSINDSLSNTQQPHPEDAYIDDILSSDDIDTPLDASTSTVYESAPALEDDEPITLSSEELDGILQTDSDDAEDFHPDFPILEENKEHPGESTSVVNKASTTNTENNIDSFVNNIALDEEELPIALSEQDLDEILLEEEGSTVDGADDKSTPATDELPQGTILVEEPSDGFDEEPIALSDDELDNILADAEASHSEDSSPQSHAAPELLPHEDDTLLTLDKSDDITSIDDANTFDTPEKATVDASESRGFFDSDDDDEPITLSDDELNGILSTTEEEESPNTHTEEIALDDAPLAEPLAVEDDDEPIALSNEELDGILMDTEGTPELEQEKTSQAADQGFFEDTGENESITLSADELDGIVASATTEETTAVESTEDAHPLMDERYADVDGMDDTLGAAPSVDDSSANDTESTLPLEEAPAHEELPALEETPALAAEETHAPAAIDEEDDGPIALSLDELEGIAADAHEVTPEAPMVPLAPMDTGMNEPSLAENTDKPSTAFEEDLESATLVTEGEAVAKENEATPDSDELKSVMGYLDNLLGELPDDVIEKFAQSEYFKLYQKIMDKLGL